MDKIWIFRGQFLDIEDKPWTKVGQGQNLDIIGTKRGHILDIFWTWTKLGQNQESDLPYKDSKVGVL